MNTRIAVVLFLIVSLYGCASSDSAAIENPKKNKLKASVTLEETGVKKFSLDSSSAPRPLYTQVYTDSSGKRIFTFLNDYNASIYFYEYETLQFLGKKQIGGKEAGIKANGYYIKSTDSIFVFNVSNIELLLENGNGQVTDTVSLIGNMNIRKSKWMLTYPQYSIQTAIPFIETPQELIFPGLYPSSIPDSIIDKFKFTSHINFTTKQVVQTHHYPRSLYSNYNWQGQIFTEVFTDLHADGDQLVYSFPVSHDLYIAGLYSNDYKIVYGGSNEAGTIHSHDAPFKKKTPRSIIGATFINNDMYGAIKYDRYRKVYYRVLRKALPGTTLETAWKEKPAIVIMMDENFNYLGETNIGTCGEWNLQNIFVTKEGLNIEYIGKNIDEEFLTLKLFNIKKI